MPTHRAPSRRLPTLPALLWAALLTLLVVSAALVLSLQAVQASTPVPTRTVTVPVPGPTVTISYLIIRTATPGVGGY